VRKTDNRRERFLTLDEVKRLGEAFDVLEKDGANIKAIRIARLWALTGCRRDEIAGLRWPEIDFERGRQQDRTICAASWDCRLGAAQIGEPERGF
jgi:integrase